MLKTFLVASVLCMVVLEDVNGQKYQSRHKRSWMMPGTLWCGAGSTAENFTNLGLFHGVDLCCREHDHCFPQIQSFEYNYGIRNYRLHTISHCDCDERFRLCLHALNDTISTLVGMMFFNILEMPCFNLREEEQCVERSWWGGCKRNSLLPKAEIRKPEHFNDSNTEGSYKSAPIPGTVRNPLNSHSQILKLTSVLTSPSPLNNAKEKRKKMKKLRKAQPKFERVARGKTENNYDAEESEEKCQSLLKKKANTVAKNRKLRSKS